MSEQPSERDSAEPDIKLPRDIGGLSRVVLKEVAAGEPEPNLPRHVAQISRVLILACAALGAILSLIVAWVVVSGHGGRMMGRASRGYLLFFAGIGALLGFAVGLCIHFLIAVVYMSKNADKYAPGVTCAKCSRKIQIPDEFAGQYVKCPLCQGVFLAPAQSVQKSDSLRE